MSSLAVIGGSGLTRFEGVTVTHREVVRTPYGETSGPLIFGDLSGNEIVFLARHGYGHTIPPHLVNYRANLWALKEAGVENIIAVNAVGAINVELATATLVTPDQIIDYTHSREHTFFDGQNDPVMHVDVTEPYCAQLRELLIEAADEAEIEIAHSATYAATQGPRFETAAEIERLARDGADIVGMTGMPEAALARELQFCYASLAVIANPAAGRTDSGIELADIEQALRAGMLKVLAVLRQAIPLATTRLGIQN